MAAGVERGHRKPPATDIVNTDVVFFVVGHGDEASGEAGCPGGVTCAAKDQRRAHVKARICNRPVGRTTSGR
jgi:hypothetical protein